MQLSAYGVDLGGFVLMHNFAGIDPLIANAIGKVLTGSFSFVVHRNFTFGGANETRKGQQAARYFSLLAFNIPVSSMYLEVALHLVSIVILAKILADGVSFCITYWMTKSFIFRCAT